MYAWEVTEEDIAIVLNSHGLGQNVNEIHEQHFARGGENLERVVKAALAYTYFGDQGAAALDEIESILVEQKFFGNAKS